MLVLDLRYSKILFFFMVTLILLPVSTLLAKEVIVFPKGTKILAFTEDGKQHQKTRWKNSNKLLGVMEGWPIVIGKEPNGKIVAAYVPKGNKIFLEKLRSKSHTIPGPKIINKEPVYARLAFTPVVMEIGRDLLIQIVAEFIKEMLKNYGPLAWEAIEKGMGWIYDAETDVYRWMQDLF